MKLDVSGKERVRKKGVGFLCFGLTNDALLVEFINLPPTAGDITGFSIHIPLLYYTAFDVAYIGIRHRQKALDDRLKAVCE
jgi:hypothetical protein